MREGARVRVRQEGDGHLDGLRACARYCALHRGARLHHEPHRGRVRRQHASVEHRRRRAPCCRVRLLYLAHRAHVGDQAHVRLPRRRAQDHPLLRARLAAHARERAQLPAPARALRNRIPHHGHDYRHLRVHGGAPKRAHRRMGRARWCAEACACHLVAYRAHAGDRGRVLRDHGQVGGLASGQPACEGGALAWHADAVPHHERARRRHA